MALSFDIIPAFRQETQVDEFIWKPPFICLLTVGEILSAGNNCLGTVLQLHWFVLLQFSCRVGPPSVSIFLAKHHLLGG